MSQITLMAQASPPADGIHETEHELGEAVLPKQEGNYTFFIGFRIFSQDDTPGTISRDIIPGAPAPYKCMAVWSRYGAPPPPKKLVTPGNPKLLIPN